MNDALKEVKTKNGQKVTTITTHAFERMKGRKISLGRLKKTLSSNDYDDPGKEPGTVDYFTKGCKVCVSKESGKIITVMWGKQYNDRGKNN